MKNSTNKNTKLMIHDLNINNNISDASLTKLARKAGVEVIGGLAAFNQMTGFMSFNMDSILHEAVFTVLKSRENPSTKKTLSENVLIQSLANLNIKMFPIDEDEYYIDSDDEEEKLIYKTYKTCKKNESKNQRVKETIRFLQSQEKDCVFLKLLLNDL